MKILIFFVFAVVLATTIACSSIPNESVFEALDSKKLAAAFKADSIFEKVYTYYQGADTLFNEIDKAKFNDITWRGLYKAVAYMFDTSLVNSFIREKTNEWFAKYSEYDKQVDSILAYWVQYKKDHSLSRFVSVEFDKLDKEYYSYSYSVKDVNLGFKLTPIECTIEQVKFSYRFSAKKTSNYSEKHYCLLTSPFSSPVVKYWKASYSDVLRVFENLTTNEFKRDYDIDIEITDVRKEGVNYSINDLNVPETIIKCLDNTYDFMDDYYREILYKDQIDPSYKSKDEYVLDKWNDLISLKFPREYAFMQKFEYK